METSTEKPGNGEDKKELLKSLQKIFTLLLQDVGLPERDISVAVSRSREEGFPFFSQTLPKLAKALDRGLANGYFKCPSSFKRKKRSSHLPAFLGSLFTEIFDDSGILLSSASSLAIKQLRTICLFAYKAHLPRKASVDSSVVERFVDVEFELAFLEIEEDSILKVSNSITRKLFSDFRPEEINPKHGPGVTSTATLTQKFEHRLGHSPAVSAFGPTFFFNEEDAMTRLSRYPVYTHRTLFEQNLGAKVILVPKDSRGPRLISCEPAEHQWCQQGIARYMVDKLETAAETAGHVNFRDQTINRELARTGSVDQKWSTLDLKDASDRVSLALVNYIFAGTKLLPSMLLCRSEFTVLPNGQKVRLHKFAPMGSALCFPVMAYCIFVLLYVSFLGIGMTDADARSSIYVYGDDVIVPSEYANYAIRILERYGLRVNQDKSFINSPFLESCGMDAFKGSDVTPIRLKKCPTVSMIKEPATAVATVECANLLRSAGFRTTAQYLYTCFERHWGPLLYGYAHSSYLCRWTLRSDSRTAGQLNAISHRRRNILTDGIVVDYGHRGHFVETVTQSDDFSVYGHFMRIWSSLGDGEQLPIPGVFDTPKSYKITARVFNHMDQSPYPAMKLSSVLR